MFDNNILANALELAVLSNYLKDKSNKISYVETAEELEEKIKIPSSLGERDKERDYIIQAKQLLVWTCKQTKDNSFSLKHFLKKLKTLPNTDTNNFTLLENIKEDGTVHYDEDAEISSKIITEYLHEKNFKDLIRKLTTKVTFSDGKLDIATISSEMIDSLASFASTKAAKGIESIDGLVNAVNFSSVDSIKGILDSAVQESSLEGILQVGYQGVAKMLGWHKGLRRGDFWMIAALQHNWKSGFTLNLAKHFCYYNKPLMDDETKKPLVLHITTENSVEDNTVLMYQSFKENETLEQIDITKLDTAEAAAYVQDKTSINGYELQMLRVNPSDFTYRSLESIVNMYEKQGYEIHCIVFDYLNMISKKGCLSGAQGMDTRDLFRRVRNFMSAKKILFITPHQISTDAKALLRQGIDNLVKELKGKSYWDSCKTVDQEVDGCIICHIEFYKGIPYFTMQLDKHRKSGAITPEEDKWCCYRMHPAGAVRDDFNMEKSQALSKLGADLESVEQEWY